MSYHCGSPDVLTAGSEGVRERKKEGGKEGNRKEGNDTLLETVMISP